MRCTAEQLCSLTLSLFCWQDTASGTYKFHSTLHSPFYIYRHKLLQKTGRGPPELEVETQV